MCVCAHVTKSAERWHSTCAWGVSTRAACNALSRTSYNPETTVTQRGTRSVVIRPVLFPWNVKKLEQICAEFQAKNENINLQTKIPPVFFSTFTLLNKVVCENNTRPGGVPLPRETWQHSRKFKFGKTHRHVAPTKIVVQNKVYLLRKKIGLILAKAN